MNRHMCETASWHGGDPLLMSAQGKPDQARDVLRQGLGSKEPKGADAGRCCGGAVECNMTSCATSYTVRILD